MSDLELSDSDESSGISSSDLNVEELHMTPTKHGRSNKGQFEKILLKKHPKMQNIESSISKINSELGRVLTMLGNTTGPSHTTGPSQSQVPNVAVVPDAAAASGNWTNYSHIPPGGITNHTSAFVPNSYAYPSHLSTYAPSGD